MPVDIYRRTSHDTLTLEELRLYHKVTAYRAERGLDPLPLSKALTATAGRHVLDLRENIWREEVDLPPRVIDLHSWSDAYYRVDRDGNPTNPRVMWDAPARLGTGYDGNGYEISAAGQSGIGAALRAWQGSPGHDALLAGRGLWQDVELRAIGIGVETSPGPGPYAGGTVFHVWFGDAADGAAPTIVGSGADETARGTLFDDVILARGGDDRVNGGRGDDRLDGGRGDDRLDGGRGSDRLDGGLDDDRMIGGFGDDRLDGGQGSDRLNGGRGDDRLGGGPGDDRLTGGRGDDRLAGGRGDDRLEGGPGLDRLIGGEGADSFVFASAGHAGRDRLVDFDPGSDLIDLRGLDLRPRDLDLGRGFVAADLDGDGRADFRLQLPDGVEADRGDLLL